MEGLWNLLVQIPLVGIFVWFVLELDKRNKTSMDKREEQYSRSIEKRDEQYIRSLTSITEVLNDLRNCFHEHDDRLKTALDMEKRKDA